MSQPVPLKAVIVDDEEHCIRTLSWELDGCTTKCEVVASFTNSLTALQQMEGLAPDVIFLDIEMPQLNGFELVSALQELKTLDSHIIFTTAYSDYAVKAFKFSAVDYLLKPVDREELEAALAKVPTPHHRNSTSEGGSLKLLFDNLHALDNGQPMRLSLPSADGWDLVEVQSIIRCASDGSYTDVHLKDGRCITVSRNLKQLEDSLPADIFHRVHNQHLINLAHVERFSRQDGGTLIMSDKSEVTVARSRKEQVLNLIR